MAWLYTRAVISIYFYLTLNRLIGQLSHLVIVRLRDEGRSKIFFLQFILVREMIQSFYGGQREPTIDQVSGCYAAQESMYWYTLLTTPSHLFIYLNFMLPIYTATVVVGSYLSVEKSVSHLQSPLAMKSGFLVLFESSFDYYCYEDYTVIQSYT